MWINSLTVQYVTVVSRWRLICLNKLWALNYYIFIFVCTGWETASSRWGLKWTNASCLIFTPVTECRFWLARTWRKYLFYFGIMFSWRWLPLTELKLVDDWEVGMPLTAACSPFITSLPSPCQPVPYTADVSSGSWWNLKSARAHSRMRDTNHSYSSHLFVAAQWLLEVISIPPLVWPRPFTIWIYRYRTALFHWSFVAEMFPESNSSSTYRLQIISALNPYNPPFYQFL